jgi:hypothetical protein
MVYDSLLFWGASTASFLIKHDVSETGSASVFKQGKNLLLSMRTVLSKGCTRVGAFLPEDGSRPSFRNVVLHQKLDDGQQYGLPAFTS